MADTLLDRLDKLYGELLNDSRPIGKHAHTVAEAMIEVERANLNWIGFTPEQAIDIAQSLIEHARKCGCTKPLTIKIG